ncbi:uncharacterized protein LOC126895811 [Daktulosphaira vitifoliae]|uniref:uncharacterized protein LOC126895811 n=1 Tax=Daktulosphaira vitifoliae TaxID=58002 RepID=UPI0021AA8DC3|nr:uncharacterized protein LOC126895811 [Daktulosphaira vitifoliae]
MCIIPHKATVRKMIINKGGVINKVIFTKSPPHKSVPKKNTNKRCYSCHSFGHLSINCYKKKALNKKNNSTKWCNYCQKMSKHTPEKCWYKNKKNTKGKNKIFYKYYFVIY